MVEDSLTAATIVRSLLDRGLPNHHLQQTETLGDALQELSKSSVDLVLLDLNLPDSSGLETYMRLKHLQHEIPIVILSSDADEALAVEAVRHGAQDYLVKSRFDHDHLSRSIRFALERSRRQSVEREVAAAEAVQQTLYPSQSPHVPGFDIAGLAFPAEQVSGDYFDFIPMSGGRLGIVIGDVSGHGVGPSLRMAETRAYLHALCHETQTLAGTEVDIDLARMLTRTNELLLVSQTAHFVTLFFVCLDPELNTFTFASAGHRVFLIGPDEVRELSGPGPVLGVLDNARFATSGPETIGPDDILLLATDGFEESQGSGRELFGTDRLVQTIQDNRGDDSQTLIRKAWSVAREFTGGAPQVDDMTAVVIQRK